jgi:hypothetical protein
MGLAAASQPINTKSLSVEANSQGRGMEILNKLSEQTGIKFAFVSPEEAVLITANTKNPYTIGKAPAFFYGDTVYFLHGSITTELAFHEFAHPIIRSLQQDNPDLFNKLVAQAIQADKSLLEEAVNEYSDLKKLMEETADPEEKMALFDKLEKIVAEEVLVKALTKAAMLKNANNKPSAGLEKFIKDLLYAIKQSMRKVFGQKINISKLDSTTTLDQLAEMLHSGGKFDINTENVSNEDVVAYKNEFHNYVEDIKKATEGGDKNLVLAMARRIYEGTSNQIDLIMKNKNYQEMINLFADEYNRGDLQEMRSNVARYAKELETKSEEMIEDIDKTTGEIQAVVSSMLRLEVMMKKMEEHLRTLKEDPNNRDNVHKSYYYSKVLNYWQKYIKEAQDMMIKAGGNPDTSINHLLDTISTHMKRSANHINQMNTQGVTDVLWEKWESMSNRADDVFKTSIENLKKRGGSQIAIDREFTHYYGMNEADYKKFQELKAKKAAGTQLSYDEITDLEKATKASFDGLHMSKEKVERALRGEGHDAKYASSFFEGYLYSTDPVIGGFALFFKDNMTEMETRVQSRVNDVVGPLKDLLDDADIKFLKPGELGKKLGFVDNYGYTTKEGTFAQKEVWTLLNPYKDYRFKVDEFNNQITDLNNRYNKSRSDEDKTALINKMAEKNAHMRKWMQQEYVDSYYEKDDLLGKDDTDVIGNRAKYLRDEIIEKMRDANQTRNNNSDLMDNTKEIDNLWKEYNLLYSEYYLNGNKKQGQDLEVTKRLKAHREATRKFFEYKPRVGVFQNELKKKEQQIRENLISLQYTPGDEKFDHLFDTYRQNWIDNNTVVKIKPEFYSKRSEIMTDIKSIMGRPVERLKKQLSDLEAKGVNTADDRAEKSRLQELLVAAENKSKKVDFSDSFKTILDVVSGFRDNNGQPKGNEMPEERKKVVKEAQQEMEDAKKAWAGFSGLTKEEMETLVKLSAEKKATHSLSATDLVKFNELLDRQDDLGLSKSERAMVIGLFADLKELQSKTPTQYYVDALNHWMDVINSKEVYTDLKITEFEVSNADKILDPKILKKLFAKSPEFEAWFNNNHIQKSFFNKDTGLQEETYDRISVWTVIKPNDPNMYETTDYIKEDGTTETIQGVPSIKYFSRAVKKEYKNGYDPSTGEVRIEIGVHKDNRGEWLPKQIANSPYINERYFQLKNADPSSTDGKLYKLLKFITKEHLKTQEGVGKRGKLYMDFPRYGMSNLEGLQSKGVKTKLEEKFGPISYILKQISNFFKGSMDEEGTVFNSNVANQLVRADGYNDQIENIPIQGLFNLELKETSTNIISSMLRYMYAAEHHKQLIKMNPIAEGLKNILENPDNVLKEQDKINRANLINHGTTTYANKKGKYIRKDAFAQFYERDMLGQSTTGAGKDAIWLQNIQKHLFGRSSFAFFALNFPSALKNMFGAKFQALIHSAGGSDLTPASLFKGEGWSLTYMTKLSTKDIYERGHKSIEHQLGEIFDPSPDRFQDKFYESITRTLAQDAVSTSALYNFRKWTELQATMQTFAGMMYKKKVPMGNTEIDYMDAWELNAQGKIQLKAGIDPKWGITYDADGNMQVGQEFKDFKNRIGIVMTKLNGSYGKLDQPLMQRYLAFRFVSFLRRYFTTMAVNRFGTKRWNPGYGETDQGYYLQAFRSLLNVMKSRNVNDMSREDAKAWMRFVTEMGTLYIMSFLVGAMWGWDDDDEDRFEKLRKKSGRLQVFGAAENKAGEEFDFGGFMSLHALNLMMQVRAENEQFIPWPGYGLDNVSTVIDLKSLALGPTTDTYQQIGGDIADIWEGSGRQFYKRNSGPYEWQQQGGRKIWAHIGKMWGLSGTNIDPANTIINFQKAKNLASKK